MSSTSNEIFKTISTELKGYLSKALLVNSGSSANLVAFYALTSSKLGDRAIKPGDKVITVTTGFPATVNPMVQFGAIQILL